MIKYSFFLVFLLSMCLTIDGMDKPASEKKDQKPKFTLTQKLCMGGGFVGLMYSRKISKNLLQLVPDGPYLTPAKYGVSWILPPCIASLSAYIATHYGLRLANFEDFRKLLSTIKNLRTVVTSQNDAVTKKLAETEGNLTALKSKMLVNDTENNKQWIGNNSQLSDLGIAAETQAGIVNTLRDGLASVNTRINNIADTLKATSEQQQSQPQMISDRMAQQQATTADATKQVDSAIGSAEKTLNTCVNEQSRLHSQLSNINATSLERLEEAKIAQIKVKGSVSNASAQIQTLYEKEQLKQQMLRKESKALQAEYKETFGKSVPTSPSSSTSTSGTSTPLVSSDFDSDGSPPRNVESGYATPNTTLILSEAAQKLSKISSSTSNKARCGQIYGGGLTQVFMGLLPAKTYKLKMLTYNQQ